MAELSIRVRLFGSLRKFRPPGQNDPITLSLPAGAAVKDLLGALGIPAERTGIMVVNDRHVEATTPLADGMEVSLFPPLAGGR